MLIFYNNKFSKLIEEPSKDTNISFVTDFKHSPCFSSACKYTSQIDHIFFYSCKNLLAYSMIYTIPPKKVILPFLL